MFGLNATWLKWQGLWRQFTLESVLKSLVQHFQDWRVYSLWAFSSILCGNLSWHNVHSMWFIKSVLPMFLSKVFFVVFLGLWIIFSCVHVSLSSCISRTNLNTYVSRFVLLFVWKSHLLHLQSPLELWLFMLFWYFLSVSQINQQTSHILGVLVLGTVPVTVSA